MEGEHSAAAARSNNTPKTTVWILRIEDPRHVWVKEPFSPAVLRLALAAPLDKTDLAYCLGRASVGLEPAVMATLSGPPGDWSSHDSSFTIQGDDPENGRPGMVICRSSSTSVLAERDAGPNPSSPLPHSLSGPAPAPTTSRKRRGFGRTMV